MKTFNFIYVLLVILVIIMLALITFINYKNKKYKASTTEGAAVLPKPVGVHNIDKSIKLSCYNLKQANYLMGSIFWLIALFFLIMIVGELDHNNSLPYTSIIDALTTGKSMGTVGIIFGGLIIYYAYHRIPVTWDNGPVIGTAPANVRYYEIKKNGFFFNMIYLQTDNKLWMLIPGTSQDNRKFKNFDLLKQEEQKNEVNVEQLRSNLVSYGAYEKHFSFFTTYLISGFCAFILAFVVIMVILK